LKDNRVQERKIKIVGEKNNPPVGSGGFDLRYFRLSSSGTVPDFRPNQITPVAKEDDLNKANNDDNNNAVSEHIETSLSDTYAHVIS
jgi:hypothetical protein